MSDRSKNFKPVLKELQKLQVDLTLAEENDKNYRLAYPPATKAQISTLEQKVHFMFPESYRSFLQLHNGWKGFHNDMAVFGVSGPGYILPKRDLDKWLKINEKILRRKGKDYVETLKLNEKSDDSVIYLPDHIVFATNFNGMFWAFDKNRQDKNGEYEVVVVSYGDVVEWRHKNFWEFVKHIVSLTKKQLAKERSQTKK